MSRVQSGRSRSKFRLLALPLALALVAGACGSSGDDAVATTATVADTGSSTTAGGGETTTPTETGGCPADADQDAILKYGGFFEDTQAGAGTAWNLDPAKNANASAYHQVWQLLYDNLLHRTYGSTEYTPGLATDWKIVDTKTIEFTLRPDVQFSDGSPLNAEAVKFSMERQRDGVGVKLNPLIGSLDNVEVTGDLTFTIHLKDEKAGPYLDMLTGGEGSIVSEKAAKDASINLSTNPVGAGPYVLDSIGAGPVISVRRNPNYWDPTAYCLAGVDFVHSALGPPTVNLFKSGSVDVVSTNLSFVGGDTSQLTDDDHIVRSQIRLEVVLMCKNIKPFDDPLVRQALNFAIDRDALNQAIYGGTATVETGLFPESSPYYDKDNQAIYSYNPEKARELLAQAGFPNGIDVKLAFYAGLDRSAQAIQAVTDSKSFRITPVQTGPNMVADFYVDGKVAPIAFSQEPSGGTGRITQHFAPGFVGNPCNYTDPTLADFQDKIGKLSPTSPEAIDLMKQASKYVLEQGLIVPLNFNDLLFAYSDKVHGLKALNGDGQTSVLMGVYMTK